MLTLPAYQPRSLQGSSSILAEMKSYLGGGFPLRCFQRLSLGNIATRRCSYRKQPAHQGFPHPSPLVLGTTPLKFQTVVQDRDRTVSRRSEPSSRTTLTGEQPDPWDLLQPQDVMSRHRCRTLLLPKRSDYTFTRQQSLFKPHPDSIGIRPKSKMWWG